MNRKNLAAGVAAISIASGLAVMTPSVASAAPSTFRHEVSQSCVFDFTFPIIGGRVKFLCYDS
ncbi:hypothetical protein HH308_02525 [Gordonia sp. TBRC 11910]|uniref:Uncharacterized protein n=1 Tax=Gordonia asplenii TaxID=2725283 RepID=A0A848KN33_9ACTN|nr:hypothetical protein [Gordonia asplenii]NMO00086.1 hypothetical protein [Gordonia asplenii]